MGAYGKLLMEGSSWKAHAVALKELRDRNVVFFAPWLNFFDFPIWLAGKIMGNMYGKSK